MKIIKKEPKQERFNVATVAQAIGRSEGSISGYFSNRKQSTKGGLTISQIEEVINSPRRGVTIDWKNVKKIRSELEARGWEFIEVEE